MTDRIVDSELDGLAAVEQLEGEKQANNEEQPVVEEPAPQENTEDTAVPPKFKGKSVDEILESYQNLEQQYGKQGNELGELRKLADSLIQKNLQESQNTVQKEELKLSEDDFLNDPVSSVRKIVQESLEPIKEAISQTTADTTMSRLQAKHPDIEEIVKDLDFQKWVMESVPRQEMWQRASAGDFNYADELFTQYKSLNKSTEMIGKTSLYLKAINSLDGSDVRISKRGKIPYNRLRGFKKGRVGPVDSNNDYVGGNYVTTLNLSTNLPGILNTVENVDFSYFIDFGNVWGVDYDSSINESSGLRSSTGVALDLLTPVGPLSFSLTQTLAKESTDKTESFRFNLGTTF